VMEAISHNANFLILSSSLLGIITVLFSQFAFFYVQEQTMMISTKMAVPEDQCSDPLICFIYVLNWVPFYLILRVRDYQGAWGTSCSGRRTCTRTGSTTGTVGRTTCCRSWRAT
jgi:hypothetical protein